MKLIHRHNEQIQEIEKLTAELEKSPAFRKMREEEAAETLKARQAAAAKIEALNQELDGLVSDKSLDVLEKKLADVEGERKKIESEIGKKRVFIIQQKAGIEGQIRVQEEILFSSYNPKIDEAIEFFNKKLDFLRSPGRISSQKMGALHNIFTMTKATKEESNLAAVNSAMLFCQSAIRALQEIKLEPVLNTEKIEQMKAAIPPIDVYSEFQGEKPLEKVNADPFSFLPTDSQMEWEKNKLLEKAKKILKR